VPVQKSSQESDEAERTQTRKRVVKATTYTERVSQQEKRDSPAKKNVTQKKESYQEEKTTVVKTAVKEINKQTTTTAEKKKGFVPVFVQIGVLLLVAVMIFLVLYNMESVPQKRLPQVPNKGN
ncbi:uncharacterized protein LOC102802767, partial [Saccoglossus kowalevskii]|uniref:Uncharacterized protein LOC102802767 n=1 Tax=Saccoglossus kowalevskii TaxID=10224 RepID=A0ABM0MZ02_SACKO